MVLNKNKTALSLGIFFALVHLVWSLAILVTKEGVQKFTDWIFALHSMALAITINPFNLVNAVLLVVMTFIIGYIFGWVFAAVFDWASKK